MDLAESVPAIDDTKDVDTSQCSGESRCLVGTGQIFPENLRPTRMHLVGVEKR